ncbi:MAG TPA: hypothetical protein VFM77_15930 [Terriglobales bacterium]|nr:hypothetical protein [Terriglobales bacterium]
MKLSGKTIARHFPKFVPAATGTAVLVLLSAIHLQSEQTNPRHVTLNPSAADFAAGAAAKNVRIHATPANTPRGRAAGPSELFGSPRVANMNSAPDAGGPRFPADLSFHGGNVVTSMQQVAIYLNPAGKCTIAACWGNPEGFLSDLAKSEFIHITDQYTGTSADDRYTVFGTDVIISYKPTAKPLIDAQILGVVHAVAAALGTPDGYSNQFHVFLPPGQDECFTDGFKTCYSPDKPNSFAFCAYHSSADFTDAVGHVLYSVEPFQDVPGCNVRPGTPNGQLADSTNNSLSHELIETITDPDGTAWWNSLAVVLFGEEIGDECSFILFTDSTVYFDPSNVTLNGKNYAIQPEYDNGQHACTTAP